MKQITKRITELHAVSVCWRKIAFESIFVNKYHDFDFSPCLLESRGPRCLGPSLGVRLPIHAGLHRWRHWRGRRLPHRFGQDEDAEPEGGILPRGDPVSQQLRLRQEGHQARGFQRSVQGSRAAAGRSGPGKGYQIDGKNCYFFLRHFQFLQSLNLEISCSNENLNFSFKYVSLSWGIFVKGCHYLEKFIFFKSIANS